MTDFLRPVWPDLPPQVSALATTRCGGVSVGAFDDGAGGGGLNLGRHVGDLEEHVAANRAALRAVLPGAPAWISQVHGIAVADAAAVVAPGAAVVTADASVCDIAGPACVVMTADCLPVLFSSMDGRVVGAAHAGWRGLAAGVLEATVDAMRARGAGEITAWLGAAIGPEAFEVGHDVLAAFPGQEAMFRPHGEKYLADIYGLARARLRAAGLSRIWGGAMCTVTEHRRFYSYRRDPVTGRQASLIWIGDPAQTGSK